MRTFRRAALLALVLSGLLTASAGAATIPPSLLVVNGTSNTLTSYPLSAHDDVPPAATVAADSTPSLDNPDGVALDAAGDAWVANVDANTLVEYSQAQLAAGGTPTPVATITATNGSLDQPTGVAFDSAGNLWVTNIGSNTLVEYTPGQLTAGGAQTPPVKITSDGANSLDAPYYLAFDAAGNLWVPNFMANTLVEFTPDQLAASGGPTPAATISADSGHDLSGPASIEFDSAGDLWTAAFWSSRLLDYTPAQLSTGAPAPTRTLAATSPTAARFDSAGDLWTTEYHANSVVEFNPAQVAAGGTPTPVDTITGNGTGLNGPANVAIEQAPAVSSVSVNGGPVGTSVPISGTGFYRGSTVKFGDTVASVKYVSP
jgi:sugar lactone lactonase YvrE